jgi:hypothetical protein
MFTVGCEECVDVEMREGDDIGGGGVVTSGELVEHDDGVSGDIFSPAKYRKSPQQPKNFKCPVTVVPIRLFASS